MRALRLEWPTREGRWRKPAIVAASLALHAVVVGYMAFQAIQGPPRYGDEVPDYLPRPPIYVQIEPRPLLRGEVARTRETPTPPRSTPSEVTDAGTRVTDATGATGSSDVAAPPSPPAPRFAPQGAAASTAGPPAEVGTAQWQVRPETLGDRVGRTGRTRSVGCANPQYLSIAEREICDDRFGERAAAARPIEGTGNPERDARFAREGERALREYEARRRPLSGGVGVVGPQDGPGSNFGMGVAGAHLDPSLRPDSTSNIRTRRDGSRAAGAPLTPGSSSPRD